MKYGVAVAQDRDPASLPTRECGLKFRFPRPQRSGSPVTPYAGVWIEMLRASLVAFCFGVTPYAGVWIEIHIVPIKPTPAV